VVKLYAPEDDSGTYLAAAEHSPSPLVASEVLEVELYYALRHKEMAGDLKRGAADRLFAKFQSDIDRGRIVLFPFGHDVREKAVEVARECSAHDPPVPVRSLDGIHLATALVAKATRLVTTDRRMRAGASVLGLTLA